MINNDSILFLLAARETLCLIAESSNMSKDHKNILTDFMISEASDYQVMSLLLDGKLPNSDINEAEEEELFKRLRVIVVANKKLVCEMFGFDVYEDVVKKIEPLYPNLSTTKPVLNFYLGSGGLNALLEAPFSELSGAAIVQQKRSRERMRKAAEFSKKGLGKVKRKIIPKAVPKAKVMPKVIKKDPLAALPPGHRGGGKRLIKPVSPAKTHRDLPMTTKKPIGKGPPPKSTGGYETKIKVTKKGPSPEAKAGLVNTIRMKTHNAVSAVRTYLGSSQGQLVAGAAIAALALYASYKVYKRFLSKAAKACGGRSGAEKTSCMKKFQISAYNAQIKDLQAASGACAKAKNPAKCKVAIAKKIYKIKQKMTKAT